MCPNRETHTLHAYLYNKRSHACNKVIINDCRRGAIEAEWLLLLTMSKKAHLSQRRSPLLIFSNHSDYKAAGAACGEQQLPAPRWDEMISLCTNRSNLSVVCLLEVKPQWSWWYCNARFNELHYTRTSVKRRRWLNEASLSPISEGHRSFSDIRAEEINSVRGWTVFSFGVKFLVSEKDWMGS